MIHCLMATAIVPFIPLIAAGVGAAVSGVALTNQPSAPPPPAPVAVQSQQAKAEQEAALAQAQALTRRRGMASTILTGPTGLSGGATTQSATLGT